MKDVTKVVTGVHIVVAATVVTLFCGLVIADAMERATGGGE
jgi:hypothetical protein